MDREGMVSEETRQPVTKAEKEELAEQIRWSHLVQGYVPQLDGLRGLAILFVLFYHLTAEFSVKYGEFKDADNLVVQGVRKLFGAGWIGVDLFFVLSGFLITGILCDTKASRNYFSSFFGRRFLRIFPLYYGLLFGMLVLLPIIWKHPTAKFEFLQENQLWYWSYLTNWLIAVKGNFSLVTSGYLWSLAVEEQFYLLWPFAVMLLPRRGLAYLCISLLLAGVAARFILLALGVPAASIYAMTFTHLDPLVVGALLALAFRAQGVTVIRLRTFKTVAGLSGIGLIVLFFIHGEFKFWEESVAAFGLVLLALLFGYMLSAAVISRKDAFLSKVLTSAPLKSFGRYSYAIYVFHPLVGNLLVSYFNPHFYNKISATSTLLPFLVFLSVSTLACWVVGFISWHLYEKHFLKMKKFFPAARSEKILHGQHPQASPGALVTAVS